MQILYLVPHVPNPTKARSHYQIRGLLDAGHRVTVVSVIRKAIDRQHIAALESQGVEVIAVQRSLIQIGLSALGGFLVGLPLQGRLMWSDALMSQIDALLAHNPPDVVHVEHLRMAVYGLRLRQRFPVVWDAIDHLGSFFGKTGRVSKSVLWRIAGLIEEPRLSRYERWLTSQFPLTMVIGARDKVLFQQENPFADRVELAAPGLPLEPFPPVDRADNTLIFTGTMDYHPNVTSLLYFAREILPIVWRTRSDVRVQVVGARPTAQVQALASDRIEITGMVPKVEDCLQRASIAIAPIQYAGGLQNKIIEAFLTRTPVVASQAAVEGLEITNGAELMVGSSPEEFAAHILTLLGDSALRQKIGESGRAYVEQHHDLRRTTARLLDLYALAQTRFQQEQQPC